MADLLTEVVGCKKAAIVVTFFLYLLYLGITIMTYVMEYKKNEQLVTKLKAIKSDLEQRQFFLVAITLLIQVITPVPFPVVILYLYLLTLPVMILGHFKREKWLIYFISIAIQKLFILILIFFVLINPWCRHYYYRYIIAEPPNSYYQSSGNSDGAASAGNTLGHQFVNLSQKTRPTIQLKSKKLKKALLMLCLLALHGVVMGQDSENETFPQDPQLDQSSGTDSSMPPLPDPNAEAPTGPIKIKIDSIEPEAGPVYGETRVLVRGGPFANMQLYYPKPMCKFGHDDMVVEATYVLCTSLRTIEEREARHRDKNDTCLQCDNNPASSKIETISFTVSLTGDFSDVTNSVPFRYYPPTRIFAIYPRYGPKDGDTVVQVWGENFLNFDMNTRCAFGSKTVVATFINSNYMICVSPFSDVVEKPIPFTISLNNQQNSRDTLFFWYYSWPAITELVPDRGPDQGGTRVLLKGRNFNPFKDENIDNANDTFCMFENLAKVPVTIINSTKAICYSPPSYVLRQSIVEITLNNQQYTDDNNIFYYYRPPYLFDVNPRESPVSGGRKVIAIGSNFRDTGNITCKFNETIVPGKFLSSSEIECITPPSDHPGYVPLSVSLEMDMYSPTVQFLYYEKPVIEDADPKCGPDYGHTQITIYGKNFLDMGHNKALCVFNKTIFTNATVMDENHIICDSISLLNSQGYSMMTNQMIFYYLEVTIDGGREIAGPAVKFTYYKDPKLSDIRPPRGPLVGNTLVKVLGSGFNQEGACNKTVRFGTNEVKPINDTNDTIIWVKSPEAQVPDAVVVGVSLNGQQFAKDIILHERDDENTFEYYPPPLVSGFTPNTGPNIGGTEVEINGIGFTPAKDHLGKPDKKKNKFWVRFVDPETGEPLAPEYEVKPEDLTDDSADYYTPQLPPNTKALMQISLNGQDWDDVPQPLKPYSFSYYESPHITKISPAFGHVKDKNDVYAIIEGTNFKCPDPNCTELYVRFGEPDQGIYVKGQLLNNTHIKVKVPKYTKPDVLRVELTVNGEDYTNDGKTYGYFDPYVLNAEPRLISVDGTTVVKIKGFGFVNSTQEKSLFSSPTSNTLVCQGKPCIKDAKFIDKNTLETNTFPQALVNYKETETNILWDPIDIDASVYENDFTDNNVEIYYYEEPDYKEVLQEESPANVENQIFIRTDFKKNPIDRLQKYSNFTCRFKTEDGKVMYTQGQMERYPLEKGAPNAVQCKSPKWDLKGKPFEQAKLDIAVNGQDFKGGFDFYFTQELMLHRTVPMAGPNVGGTKTRLIGSGFKPPRSTVQAKWGVLSTETIPKSLVEDYIYYKLQFENMIEGSEELKAYAYEASQFARADSNMDEGQSYHAVYMNPPQLANWTKTQGGPYYVEVGKNIEIQYHTKVNVTVKTKSQQTQPTQPSQPSTTNQTVNGTSTNNTNTTSTSNNTQTTNNTAPLDVYTTVEQDVIKSWVYYEYDPSCVEYYYYKDAVVKDMQPHSGLIAGGTPVAVVGAWFKYMPEYGVVPHCKFGNKIVRAQFDSTVRIVCKAPPNDELGVMYPFEVSLNGIDWSDTGFKFTYYENPTISSISPSCGPESGGTMVYIYGQNFTNVSNPSEFNCKFSPTNLPIPPKKMPGIFINSTTIMCASPGGWGQGDAVKLQVTFNGGDYDDNNFIFTFFSVTRAFPRSGPSDGTGGEIIIEGFGFRNDTEPLCKINNTVYPPTSVTWKQIRCPMPIAQGGEKYFGNVPLAVSPNGKDWNNFVGGFQYYPQPTVDDIFPKQGPSIGIGVINFYGEGFRDDYNLVDLACKIGDSIGKAVYMSPRHIKCVIEDMELVNEGEYLPAQLALNRYSWTTLTNSTMFLPYGIEQIYPNSGPTTGVTDVIVQGKGFVDEEGNTARCRFGTPANYAIVDAQILSYERLACKAPQDYKLVPPSAFPEDVPFSIAFTSDEYDPWTETSHKFRFYDQPIPVRCDPCDVEVGTMTEVLVWADENTPFFEPVPLSKPSEAEQSGLVNLGSGLGGITCQFGRFGESQAIYINETVIKCVSPSVEDDPNSIYRETVKLTVAMNGVDHDEEASQVEFTFIGTGTYLVFWPFIIGALLIGLLIVALVLCCTTIFQKMSMDDMLASKQHVGNEGLSHVFRYEGGVMVPRGRADWNADRSSVDMIEKASAKQFYQ